MDVLGKLEVESADVFIWTTSTSKMMDRRLDDVLDLFTGDPVVAFWAVTPNTELRAD